MELQDQSLPTRIVSAVLFALIFSVVGTAIPDIYFRYLDRTQYLQISLPIDVDKEQYTQCDSTLLTTHLNALVDVNVTALTELVLVRDTDQAGIRTGYVLETKTPVRALQDHVVGGLAILPCDVPPGRYFWQGNATYFVRGVEKNTPFFSESFLVTETTESAQPAQ